MGNCLGIKKVNNVSSKVYEGQNNLYQKEYSEKQIELKKMINLKPKTSNKGPKGNFIVFGQNKSGKDFFMEFDFRSKNWKDCSNPKSSKFYNYSAVTMIDELKMIICGGINHNLKGITNECYEYNFQTHEMYKLNDMKQIRYTFPIISHRGYIYAIGGRIYGADDVSLLKKCERMNLDSGEWEDIADMNVNRCTSSLFIYMDQIWVIGGYSGKFKRSRKIEKYNEYENRWEIVDFKLFAGFENGNILATGFPNEMIILGGKLNCGTSKTAWYYNLKNKNVINTKPLLNRSVLSQYHIYGDNICIISGENGQATYELYNYKNPTIKTITNKLSKKKNLDKFKQYNFNSPKIEIPFEDSLELDFTNLNYEAKNIIFGTDQEPFQIEIDQITGQIDLSPVPTNLTLKNFQSCTRVNSQLLFFCGGIGINFKKITDKCFMYDLKTRTIEKVDKMTKARYTFSCEKLGNYIYAIGGREYGADKIAIFNNCERFDLITKKWEYIGSLNIGRCTSNSFIYNNEIYVAGGFTPNSKRTNTIEVYRENSNTWEMLGIELKECIEASVFVARENQIHFFGGRLNKKGDTDDKYSFNIEEGDLAEVKLVSEKLKFKGCLHKVVSIAGDFLTFGGNPNNYSLLDGINLRNKPYYVKDTAYCRLDFNEIQKDFKIKVELVSYDAIYLKRNAVVLPVSY